MNRYLKSRFLVLFSIVSLAAYTTACGGSGEDGLDGQDGQDGNSVTVVDLEEGDENCPEGGQKLSIGTETDLDGEVIEDSESTSIYYVCNGEDGVDGEDGQSVIVVEREATEEECANGGTFFEFGYPDGEGELVEVLSDAVICNGEDAQSTTGFAELAPPPASCSDEPSPERCAEDPATYDQWAPASLITSLEVANATCCFDFDGNGRVDNNLPGMISLFSTLGDFNRSLANNIENGRLTLILEHFGLKTLENGEVADTYVYLGEKVDDQGVLIDPASFDDGAYPQALLPGAAIFEDDGALMVTAGPGKIYLEVDLFGVNYELALHNTQVEARIVGTTLEGGVMLEDGIFGGLFLFEDFAQGVNELGQTCDCLGNPTESLYIPDGDVSGAACILDVTQSDIDSCGGGGCRQLAEFCEMIPLVNTVGLPTTEGGPNDAFGAGFRFQAEPTVILGLLEEEI